MQTKKLLMLLILVSVLLVANTRCICEETSDTMEIEISPTDKNIHELTGIVYSETILSKIIYGINSLEELNRQYPVKCMREVNGMLRIAYLGEDSVLILFFNDEGDKIYGKVFKTIYSKDDYSVLNTGDSLDKVESIDPEGEYLFLKTGRNDTPRQSTHYTKDGYILTIRYDDLNEITSISEELI